VSGGRRGRCKAINSISPQSSVPASAGCANALRHEQVIARSPSQIVERPERIPAFVEELRKMPIDDFLQIE
jgi:hypothetical protein